MSFGVDTLGGLTEKLKQLVNDTQNHYESFIDFTQLYRQGKMNEKEYFAKIGDYLVASSAMSFLAVRVILELKSAIDKGTSIKSPTGGVAAEAAPQAGFGIGGFVGTGGHAGGAGGYTFPAPSSDSTGPSLKPVDIEVSRPSRQTSVSLSGSGNSKNCIVCGSSIPKQAKFCSKCGSSQ